MSADTVITVADITNPAYRALRLPPGTIVDYRGSITTAHGTWTVRPCACNGCLAGVLVGRPATRYQLVDADGRTPGPRHVRHTSVVPVVSDEERNYAGEFVPTRVTAVHLRRSLRAAFPGVKFSVRCGRRDAKDLTPFEITVSWTGGPTRTAVATVTAPLLATFGTAEERRARRISVTTGGRTHSGTPNVAAIHLRRS
ncbi:LPD29 domain-containing protein [Streptomyces anulatus]|uniref:LPD29 domain-containing protein n=1 Tax=Streptomyces anulatus TaxID=1892 RepID=UPI001C26C6CD|nr:LPD29 domain-containing protein [Streptomyces anulatus]